MKITLLLLFLSTIQQTAASVRATENFYRYVIESGLSFDLYEKFLNQSQKMVLPAVKKRLAKMFCENVFQ